MEEGLVAGGGPIEVLKFVLGEVKFMDPALIR